jgi:hypothetical protein
MDFTSLVHGFEGRFACRFDEPAVCRHSLMIPSFRPPFGLNFCFRHCRIDKPSFYTIFSVIDGRFVNQGKTGNNIQQYVGCGHEDIIPIIVDRIKRSSPMMPSFMGLCLLLQKMVAPFAARSSG